MPSTGQKYHARVWPPTNPTGRDPADTKHRRQPSALRSAPPFRSRPARRCSAAAPPAGGAERSTAQPQFSVHRKTKPETDSPLCCTPAPREGKLTPLPETTPRLQTRPARTRNEPPHVARGRSTHTEERGPQPLSSAAPLSADPGGGVTRAAGRDPRSTLRAAIPHPARARTSAGPSSARRPRAASSRRRPAPPWLRRTAPPRCPTRPSRGGPGRGVSWAAAPPGGRPLSLPPCGARRPPEPPYLLPFPTLLENHASPVLWLRAFNYEEQRRKREVQGFCALLLAPRHSAACARPSQVHRAVCTAVAFLSQVQ